MAETRYWQRVGFRVSKEQALEMVEKMKEGVSGKVMDEDLDEYVNVDAPNINSTLEEIDALFEDPDDEQMVDDDNANILALMEFEKTRKQFIIDCKAEGMETAEAKAAYEAAKADMVRTFLNLPEPTEEEE